MSKYGPFSDPYFPGNGIQGFTQYITRFCPNTGKYGSEERKASRASFIRLTQQCFFTLSEDTFGVSDDYDENGV